MLEKALITSGAISCIPELARPSMIAGACLSGVSAGAVQIKAAHILSCEFRFVTLALIGPTRASSAIRPV